MQIIDLELDHNNFYCPVTGSKILSEDSFDSCPSLQGLWTNHSEEPETLQGELEKLWKVYLEKLDEDDFHDVPEFLKSVDNNDFVAFAVTTGGMACGPVSSTVWLVIDMNHNA